MTEVKTYRMQKIGPKAFGTLILFSLVFGTIFSPIVHYLFLESLRKGPSLKGATFLFEMPDFWVTYLATNLFTVIFCIGSMAMMVNQKAKKKIEIQGNMICELDGSGRLIAEGDLRDTICIEELRSKKGAVYFVRLPSDQFVAYGKGWINFDDLHATVLAKSEAHPRLSNAKMMEVGKEMSSRQPIRS